MSDLYSGDVYETDEDIFAQALVHDDGTLTLRCDQDREWIESGNPMEIRQ